jgi:peptidoglycan/xylan/chitin deacetylase (PgdA/CDA1 family)
MNMVGYKGTKAALVHKSFAPLLAAAALLSVGCASEDRGALNLTADRAHEERTSPAGPPNSAKEHSIPVPVPNAAAAGNPQSAASSEQTGEKAAARDGHGSAGQIAAIPNAESGSKNSQAVKISSDNTAVATDGSSAHPVAGSGSAAPTQSAAPPAAAIADTASKPPKKLKFSIPVLNYHSIAVDPDNNAVLDPKKLEEQMDFLAAEGYTTLTLRQFIDIWDGKAEVPAKAVLLTFDDGYTDNYTDAMPILKKHGFRATMFVSPGMVGQDGYFAEWDQIREMRDNGWDIQPHGMTHPYLHKMTLEQQRFEIAESIKQLKEHTGIDTEAFCYPYGMRNKDTLKLLEEAQVRFAFTIDQGRTEPTQQPLQLKRIFVGGKESMATFVKKLKP